MRTQDQINMLKEIAGINTDELDALIDENFDKRTHINRKELELRAIVEKYSDGAEKVEKKSATTLLAKKQEIIDNNAKINNAKDLTRRAETAIISYDKEILEAEERIRALKANKEIAEKTIAENKELSLKDVYTTHDLDQDIASIEANNEKAVKWETYQVRVKEHMETKKEADGMDELIDSLRAKRIKMFVDA